MVAFNAGALDYRFQFDVDCTAPATAVRDYPLAFPTPREVLFLSEEASVQLKGGHAFGEPLVVDAQQIGRLSSSNPTLAVQAGRFGAARITASTAAVCQTTPWSARFDYVIGRRSADTASVLVDRGTQRTLTITDTGKRRFAARLASSSNNIFDALLGPEQRWTRDLLASGMDSAAINRFRTNFCPACTDEDVRWFAERFSKYLEEVGPGELWSSGIDARIAVAYAFPVLPPSAPSIRHGEDVPDDPFRGALVHPTALKDLMASPELGWQLSASYQNAFTPANAIWLADQPTGLPMAENKLPISRLDKECVKNFQRALGDSDSAVLASLCAKRVIDFGSYRSSERSHKRPYPHPIKLIDITLPARQDQPKVVLRFWHRDGAIYLYNVMGLSP